MRRGWPAGLLAGSCLQSLSCGHPATEREQPSPRPWSSPRTKKKKQDHFHGNSRDVFNLRILPAIIVSGGLTTRYHMGPSVTPPHRTVVVVVGSVRYAPKLSWAVFHSLGAHGYSLGDGAMYMRCGGALFSCRFMLLQPLRPRFLPFPSL